MNKNNPIVKTVGVALLVLPAMYVAEILAGVVHEVLGHGLSAVLLGGEFSGFMVKWDTMAWAFSDLPATAPLAHHILYLASGIIVTTIGGLILWGFVFFFREKPAIQLVLLVAAFVVLIDGISYVLWDAWYPLPRGDSGRVIWLCGGPEAPAGAIIRGSLILTSATLFAGVTFYFCAAIFARVEALILPGGQFVGRSRFLALFFCLALPGSYEWLSFDWNQMAHGSGRLPNVAGALSIIVVATILFWYRPKLKRRSSVPPITWRHMAVSWTCLLSTVAALAFGLADGVRWGPAEKKSATKLTGPFSISPSGAFLFCGIERDDTQSCYVVVSLGNSDSECLAVPYDECLGATWRPGTIHEELLFVTGGDVQSIKKVNVSESGITEISSEAVDPNLFVMLQSGHWNPGGNVLALRANNREGGLVPGAHLGFLKDGGGTISVSAILSPVGLLWVDDRTFYMVHATDSGETVMSRATLDVDSMTVEMHDVLESPSYIWLATQNLHGSVLYGLGNEFYRDNELLAVMPEKVQRPFVDGDYVASVSADGDQVFVLDATGHVVRAEAISERSICIGISAENETVYLTARSPEDRVSIYAYDFIRNQHRIALQVTESLFESLADSNSITD